MLSQIGQARARGEAKAGEGLIECWQQVCVCGVFQCGVVGQARALIEC